MKTSKCRKHGVFTEEAAYVSKDTRYKDSKRLVCKKCHDAKKIRKFKGNTNTHCSIHGELNEENAYKSIEQGKLRFKCKLCMAVWRKERYAKNRDKAIIDAAKWKKENRERVNKQVAQDKINNPEKYEKWRKDYYERNAKDINTRAIARYHGLDVPTYEDMFEAQDNQCAICGKEETRKLKGTVMRLCVDHDHKTGKIRSLLCHDCNSGLGKFYDSADLLTKAAIYLMDHEACH
jgi:hypothetical protein